MQCSRCPTRSRIRHTAAAYMVSLTFRQTQMKSGTTDRMQSTVPMIFRRVYSSLYSASLLLTMPVTPYAVSKGSFSRNSYSLTLDAVEMKIATPIATSTRSTQRPRPAAAFSPSGKPGFSLSAPSMISTAGERMHRNVATAIFSADSFLNLIYSEASSMLTRRSGFVSPHSAAVCVVMRMPFWFPAALFHLLISSPCSRRKDCSAAGFFPCREPGSRTPPIWIPTGGSRQAVRRVLPATSLPSFSEFCYFIC